MVKHDRSLLFGAMKEFGPYRDWTEVHTPGRGLNQKYDEVLRAYATLVGCGRKEKNGDVTRSVQQQINFAIQYAANAFGPSKAVFNGWANCNEGHIYSAIMNMAAALEAGFILYSDLPKM